MLKSKVKQPENKIKRTMKNTIEKIELAKAYVALSNAHQLSLVNQMFAEHASYDSTGVGLFEGQKNIANMMNDFFSQYPDVHWKTQNFRCDGDDNVLFDFEMKATHVDTKDTIRRNGLEQITFTKAGLISRIEVTAS